MRLGESPLKFAIGPADGDEVSVSLMILMELFAVLSAGSFLIWICLYRTSYSMYHYYLLFLYCD